LTVSLLLPFGLSAAGKCPFLNAATAAGIVGGPVSGTYTASSKTADNGSCQFIGNQSSGQAELGIDVETMAHPQTQFSRYLAKCDSIGEPIKAIGNEAVACSPASNVELIVGRVRDRVFIIRLNLADSTAQVLRRKATDAAELVAGNLY
jgi:hypothetical protein